MYTVRRNLRDSSPYGISVASGGRIYNGSFACCDATLFQDDDVLPEGGTNAEAEPTRQEMTTTTTVIAAAMLIKDDTPTNLMILCFGLIWFDYGFQRFEGDCARERERERDTLSTVEEGNTIIIAVRKKSLLYCDIPSANQNKLCVECDVITV